MSEAETVFGMVKPFFGRSSRPAGLVGMIPTALRKRKNMLTLDRCRRAELASRSRPSALLRKFACSARWLGVTAVGSFTPRASRNSIASSRSRP